MNHGEFLISFLIDLQRVFRTKVVPKDLPYSQVQAIIIIPSDGIEMSELSLTLGLDNSTVTRLVERLEVKGFVKRKKNKLDKRSIIVSLKKKGMSIQKSIEKKLDEIGEQIFFETNQSQKEISLENLSSFQWKLRKTFLKR
ncbi:MarR family transcriptional regulator [Candidatus Marinimicrobia bacterium]|nr:MarR family transcriptional regulator [Candidatus Neomarinimicrobiota bacterium]|tara:strand:+ start:53 stop:475 length:423 start_codon:yes stop_codon:yes gene_type:complete